jgi:hypothetical protein
VSTEPGAGQFLNAQNKQTIYSIIKPLRELGIPAAAIVDIDILKEGGTVWSNLLGGAHVPEIEVGPLSAIRKNVLDLLVATGKNMKRDGGIDLLSGTDKEAAENLFERLAEYGVFCVPRGELETWLPDLGVKGKAPAWLIEIFEKLGNDPSEPSYKKPTSNDVWRFIGSLKSWFFKPDRKGIPN